MLKFVGFDYSGVVWCPINKLNASMKVYFTKILLFNPYSSITFICILLVFKLTIFWSRYMCVLLYNWELKEIYVGRKIRIWKITII